MTTYAWPGWKVSCFEMRVVPNTRVFNSPFNPASAQVVDLLGELWQVMIELPPRVSPIDGAAREAFFDRLRGPVNRISLWNLRFPAPQGTLRDGAIASVVNGSLAPVAVVNASLAVVTVVYGTPVLGAALAQLAGTATINHIAGRTLRAGDPLGINGQLVRIMADATADGAGQMTVEFLPRMRSAVAAGAVVTWDRPTATFMLRAAGVPTTWRPGLHDAVSLDLIETF